MATKGYYLNSSLSDGEFKLSCETVLSKSIRFDPSSLDATLIKTDLSKPYIDLENGQRYMWYFAYGSMVNPISLYLRKLTPLYSFPAIVSDYKLCFRGTDGMANIERFESANMHGVVHLMTTENIHQLDVLEDTYHRIEVNVVDYQHKERRVFAYEMVVSQLPTLPSERYLDVIVKGYEYFGVCSSYVDQLKFHQCVVPRKSSATYHSIDNVPEKDFYTYEELSQHDGKDPDLPLWVSINGKVLQYTGPPTVDHPDYKLQCAYYKFYQSTWGGREISCIFARAMYEPLYRLPLNEEDLCDEHRAMIEDSCIDWMGLKSTSSYWKPIGRLISASNSVQHSSRS